MVNGITLFTLNSYVSISILSIFTYVEEMLNLVYLLYCSIKGLSINIIPCKPCKEKCCNETLSYPLYFNVTYIYHNFQKVCRTCYVISNKNIHFVLDRVGIVSIITFLSYTDRYIVWMPPEKQVLFITWKCWLHLQKINQQIHWTK